MPHEQYSAHVRSLIYLGLTLIYILTTKEKDSLFVCLLFLADGLFHPIYKITGLMCTCHIEGNQYFILSTKHKLPSNKF